MIALGKRHHRQSGDQHDRKTDFFIRQPRESIVAENGGCALRRLAAVTHIDVFAAGR